MEIIKLEFGMKIYERKWEWQALSTRQGRTNYIGLGMYDVGRKMLLFKDGKDGIMGIFREVVVNQRCLGRKELNLFEEYGLGGVDSPQIELNGGREWTMIRYLTRLMQATSSFGIKVDMVVVVVL